MQKEEGTAANIKDKVTKKAVQRAIRKLIAACPTVTGSKGLAMFACEDSVAVLEPEIAVSARWYRCDRVFHTDRARLHWVPRASHAWACGYAHLTGTEVVYGTTEPGNKAARFARPGGGIKRHNKGGQSAPRFQRMFDSADDAWCKQAGEWIQSQTSASIRHVVVGGPGIDQGFARLCGNIGVDVRIVVADGNPTAFGRKVREEIAPAWEIDLARVHEANIWERLQTEPDWVRVGARDVEEALDESLAHTVWAEPGVLTTPIPPNVKTVLMPRGSLARVGGVAAVLHYAVPFAAEA